MSVEASASETTGSNCTNGFIYIDEPIFGRADTNDDGDFADSEEQFYYTTNNLYCVTAVLDTSGDIIERYEYTPYGELTVYTDASSGTWWDGDETTGSLSGNYYTYTGRRSDSESDLMYYRNRYYSSEFGRFVSADPIGYVNGMNLYAAYFVPTGMDPMGKYDYERHTLDYGCLWDAAFSLFVGGWKAGADFLGCAASCSAACASGIGSGGMMFDPCLVCLGNTQSCLDLGVGATEIAFEIAGCIDKHCYDLVCKIVAIPYAGVAPAATWGSDDWERELNCECTLPEGDDFIKVDTATGRAIYHEVPCYE